MAHTGVQDFNGESVCTIAIFLILLYRSFTAEALVLQSKIIFIACSSQEISKLSNSVEYLMEIIMTS